MYILKEGYVTKFFRKILGLENNKILIISDLYPISDKFIIKLRHRYKKINFVIYLEDRNNNLFLSFKEYDEEIDNIVNNFNKKNKNISYKYILKFYNAYKYLKKYEKIDVKNHLLILEELSFVMERETFYKSAVSSSFFRKLLYFNFFDNYILRRNSGDSIDIKNSSYHIEHAEAECSFCKASGFYSDDNTTDFFSFGDNFEIDYSYYYPEENNDGDEAVTNITGYESIMGGSLERVKELLNNVDENKYDDVDINLCCMPTIIGDDPRSVVKQYSKKLNIPIFYTDQNLNSNKNMHYIDLIEKKINRNYDGESKTLNNKITLIGYPHNKSLIELSNILGMAGLEIDKVLLPILDLKSVDNLDYNSLFVSTNIRKNNDIQRICNLLPNNKLELKTPFGFINSKEFIYNIIKNFNLKKYDIEKIENYISSKEKDFNLLKNESHYYNIGFVLLPDYIYDFLGDFRNSDILNLLLEMGFNIKVMIYMNKNSYYKDSINKLFDKKKNNIELMFSDNTSDMNHFIRNEIDIMYSEVNDDKRILNNNKLFFSLSDFNMGLSGAIDTFNNLLKLCKVSRSRNYLNKELVK